MSLIQSLAFTLLANEVPTPVTVDPLLVIVPVVYVVTEGANGSPVLASESVALLTAFVLVKEVKPPLNPTPSLWIFLFP